MFEEFGPLVKLYDEGVGEREGTGVYGLVADDFGIEEAGVGMEDPITELHFHACFSEQFACGFVNKHNFCQKIKRA